MIADTPDNGGLVSFNARSTGEPVNVAVLPFLPTRHIVRAAQVAAPQAENTNRYDEATRQILGALTAGFTDIPITQARRLRTVTGSVEELIARSQELAKNYLRVVLTEPAVGEVRERLAAAFPDMLELRIDPSVAAPPARSAVAALRSEATAQELFERYCADTVVSDPGVSRLFAELHDEANSAPASR
jgi:exonuclease SbcD